MKRFAWLVSLVCLLTLSACSMDTSLPDSEAASSESSDETSVMPGYVPIALRGDLQTTSTEGVDAYYEERSRTFSNGETFTYWVADNMVVEGDMLLYDDAEAFEALLDEYERYLKGQADGTLGTQSVFAEPHCITRVIACLHYTQNGRKWPGGKVYFDRASIEQNFSSDQRDEIFAAIRHIENKTNREVYFQEVKPGDRNKYPNRIVFKNEPGAGCYSKLGYQGGGQTLMLGNSLGKPTGCADYLSTVIHELGHAVGLLHEHQRCDRDRYINVNDPNLKSKAKSNFGKECGGDATTYGSFDYLSIMMYPVFTRDASFVNNTSLPMFNVIGTLPTNPRTGRQMTRGEIGLLDFLSPRDIAGLKARY